MILCTNQPYFCPYPGFFYKAHLTDFLVILDTVQFPRGTTWLTRNRFKNDQGTLWMTIPVWKKGLGLQKINKVHICHEGYWAKKHLASVKSAYSKAPYLKDHLDFFKEIFLSNREMLIDMNMFIIKYLFKQLQIKTKIILLSELGIEARGSQLIVEICRKMGADRFLAQTPAKKYLDIELFINAGIKLDIFNLPSLVYPQLWGDFIPNLSIFDLILNCGPKVHDILKSEF